MTINSLMQTNERLKVETTQTLEKLRNDIIETLNKNSPPGHTTDLEDLAKQILALAEESKRVDRQQKILRSLIFEEMEQREETIKDAHIATLNWMVEKNETMFIDWLEAEKGVYWLKGKVSVVRQMI
jgi:hypothetical protein